MELLVRVHDKHPFDKTLSCAGDVIVACRDGWPWSVAERTSNDWRILRVRGLSDADASTLVQPQAHRTPNPNEKLRHREFGLRLDLLDSDDVTPDQLQRAIVRRLSVV